jgi:hypothetical protein
VTSVSRAIVLAVVAWLVFSAALLAQAGGSAFESQLLQTAHIRGDPYEGFVKACLIVYPNGRFHRERRKQVSESGHAQDRWESPEVFEAQFDPSEIERLQAMIQTPGMMSISGTIGDVQDLVSKVAFAPNGVVPHGDIEILTILIARRDHPQIFEVANMGFAQRQDALNTLIEWIKGAEHHEATRLPAAAANNCIGLSAMTIGLLPNAAELDTGLFYPTPIRTPNPPRPPNTPARHSMKVEFVVNADGIVSQALLKDRATPDVAQSILDTVRSWQFHPARLLGVPVAARLQVEIAF